MDDGGPIGDAPVDLDSRHSVVPSPFIAAEVLQRINVIEVKHKLARIVDAEIVPRLIASFSAAARREGADGLHPSDLDIARLARLVLDPDVRLSTAFVEELRDGGLSMETLFVELLEPAARYLGRMWETDECDFVEVTLGVGRLQHMLALFNGSAHLPTLRDKRRVCMMAMADEPHSFGVAMVEKFLRAGGWSVHSERGVTPQRVAPLMKTEWFAVAGLTASSDRHLGALERAIRIIRTASRNPAIGIMVGGPPFAADPALARQIGADASAVNAPAAVLLAQKLFDAGASPGTQRP